MRGKIFCEFKKFIARGSVIDLAVGVIIGSAFSNITNSLVNDIIMPFIGFLSGGVDFSDKKLVLFHATETLDEVAIRYGAFINTVFNFLLIAIVLFFMVKTVNTLKEKAKKEEKTEEESAPPQKSDYVVLLEEIRDILRKEKNS